MQSLQKSFFLILFIITPIIIKADSVLGQFMPYNFFENLSYIETTQEKLLSTTNAEKVFSFDYVVNEEIFASVHATQTKGETYDRHVNVFRRSEGYDLVDIELINVEQYAFLLSNYKDINQEQSYVLAFSLEFVNGEFNLHSHWSPKQINTIHRLYNYEITFFSRQDVLFFLPLLLDKINQFSNLNMVNEDLVCPKLYVSKYEYVNEQLECTMHNEIGEEWIVVSNENIEIEVLLDKALDCQISIPWEETNGVLMKIENEVDYQQDLLFIKAYNIISSTIEQDQFRFEIFPNPTTDYLNIKANGSIQLVDVNGRVIYSVPKVQGEIQLDLSNLPSMQYFIINNHNSQIDTKEVIVI